MGEKYPIGGYAPGNYYCTCCICGSQFQGDKRAVECESCAVAAKAKFDALSPEEQEELMKRNAELINKKLMDLGKLDLKLAIIGHGMPENDSSEELELKVHNQIIANQVAGMSLEKAIYEAGYSAGMDFEREIKGGVDWAKRQFDSFNKWLSEGGYSYDGEYYYDEKNNFYAPDQIWERYSGIITDFPTGAVWVKANKRLPINNNLVHINFSTGRTDFKLTGYYEPSEGKWYKTDRTILEWAPNLEWLDESGKSII